MTYSAYWKMRKLQFLDNLEDLDWEAKQYQREIDRLERQCQRIERELKEKLEPIGETRQMLEDLNELLEAGKTDEASELLEKKGFPGIIFRSDEGAQ